MTIRETRKYELFVQDKTNRPITDKDKPKLKALTESMEKYGFLPFPILVVKDGERLKIIDGQHRFQCAKQIGLPVLYVESPQKDIVIAETAACQTPWSMNHYMESFAAQGDKNFQKLKEFCAETGIPIGAASSILSGKLSGSGRRNTNFKNGEFTVNNEDSARRVARIVGCIRQHVPWALTSLCISAVSRFVIVPEFDDAQFIKRVTSYPHMLNRCATLEGYSEMLADIYNHASRQRIPLAFMAKEAASERSATTIAKSKRKSA